MALTMSSYAVLSDDEVAHALHDLPGWRGDSRRITRTVATGDLWGLLERVAAAEAQLDHHTVVDLESGTVTFTLWTHVRDAVTGADLQLARLIDRVVDGA